MKKYSPIFETIINTDKELTAMRAEKVTHFSTGSRLVRERRSLTRDAERALSWIRDKGNTA